MWVIVLIAITAILAFLYKSKSRKPEVKECPGKDVCKGCKTCCWGMMGCEGCNWCENAEWRKDWNEGGEVDLF